MIIDFHFHYLKKEKFILNALKEMDRAGVEKSLLLATPSIIFLGCNLGSNEDVLQVIKKYPDRFIGCMYIDPRDKNAIDEVKKYYNEGFKCIKMFPPVGFYPDDPKWSSVFECIDDLKIPILCHTGQTNSGYVGEDVRRKATNSAFALPIHLDGPARLYPNITFILAHMGYPFYTQAWSVAHANQNVYLDISGAGPWIEGIPKVYNSIGRYIPIDFNRVTWGSDNCFPPKESMKVCLQLLKEMGLSEKYKPMVFGETARRILQI